jgi:(2Fe-2S) ferredoxin
MEPMATIQTADGTTYHYGHLDGAGRVHEIVRSHLVEGAPVAKFLIQT